MYWVDGHACANTGAQADVILDDYCGELPVDLLLTLLDRYAFPNADES